MATTAADPAVKANELNDGLPSIAFEDTAVVPMTWRRESAISVFEYLVGERVGVCFEAKGELFGVRCILSGLDR